MTAIGSALWGGENRRARARVLAAVLALAALSAPATARADVVPGPLLEQAAANPDQTFDVIVQAEDGTANPADSTVEALTHRNRRTLEDAVKRANATAKRAAVRRSLAARAADRAAAAQQVANDAAARAARTGKSGDRAAAARAQAVADRARVSADDAQAVADAARGAVLPAQAGVTVAQDELFAASEEARRKIGRTFRVIPAVSARLTGADVAALAEAGEGLAVVSDGTVRPTEANPQTWVQSVGAQWFWDSWQRTQALQTPAIAVVDSGVDTSRVGDFGGRVLAQVDLTSGSGPNSPGDGRGHGTMVASLAAGGSDSRAGTDPDARLVSLDVIDDYGAGKVSDVIAAIDWIVRHRSVYNIRVANFSLQASSESSFLFDPLSLAVEHLWLKGIVVVAAAGNYATGGAASGVLYAPASDPFVITVGALDTSRTADVRDDVAAPWSSWGYTADGFLKPELSAPGRYMIGAAPPTSTLARGGGQNPFLVWQGYLQLSGTSFAAPIVSGAAAAVLSLHPGWTPGQVKGALMVSANALSSARFGSAGVGEVDLRKALGVTSPPNPNAALDSFVVSTYWGPVFASQSWLRAARDDASWSSASWSSASWSSASWSSASWTSASWSSASWSSASWSSASWSSASWSSAMSGSSLAPVDGAAADGDGSG